MKEAGCVSGADEKDLNPVQEAGIRLGLTREQVLEGFFWYTLRGVEIIYGKDRGREMPDEDVLCHALELVSGLDSYRVSGVVVYGLHKGEIMEDQHFGEHTVEGISCLMRSRNIVAQDAYQLIKGLNIPQVDGVCLGLDRAVIEADENFGNHTVAAIREEKKRDPAMLAKAAYEIYQGKEPYQIQDMLYPKDREDVEVAVVGRS